MNRLTPQPAPPLVAPPRQAFTRARRWKTFERIFAPIERNDGGLIWEPWQVPKDSDYRFWWTVIDPMTTGQLYLSAGFHFVNRLGYVQCANGFDGEWSDHPEYLY